MCGSVGTVSLFFHCAQREKHSEAPKTDVLKFSKHAERAKKTSEPLQFRGFLIWQRVKDSNPHIQSQSLLCYLYTNPLDLSAAVISRSEQILLYRILLFCQ